MTASPSLSSRIVTFALYAVMHALFAFLGLAGLATVISAILAITGGGADATGSAVAIAAGSFLFAIGGGFFYLTYVLIPRRNAAQQQLAARYPDQPWMLRKDWAARRVADRSGLAVVIFMGVWCAGWWGAMALIWSVNREKIIAAVQQSWGEAALIGCFVLGGVAGLTVLVGALRTWWTYGHATLTIETLPGYLGDSFRGSISVRLPARPKGPLDVTLVCEDVLRLRRRKSGGGYTTETTYDELWSGSASVEPARLLTIRGVARIPVDMAIPNSQPECALDENGNGTRWVLRVHGLIDGQPGLSFEFEVPVYRRR